MPVKAAVIFFSTSSGRGFRAALLAAMALISGCETVPEALPGVPAEKAWQQRVEALSGLDSWVCNGRVGASDGKESFSGSLRWRQTQDAYQIRLSGPLGQGLVEVKGSPQGVSLRTSDQNTYMAPTPEALLDQYFGWRLPVTGLRYWIMGLPMPGVPIAEGALDLRGRLARLEQSGWRIQYLAYRQVGELELPAKLVLEHPRLSARIVISRWQLES
jgi:outer membrane lipoprotein LolB